MNPTDELTWPNFVESVVESLRLRVGTNPSDPPLVRQEDNQGRGIWLEIRSQDEKRISALTLFLFGLSQENSPGVKYFPSSRSQPATLFISKESLGSDVKVKGGTVCWKRLCYALGVPPWSEAVSPGITSTPAAAAPQYPPPAQPTYAPPPPAYAPPPQPFVQYPQPAPPPAYAPPQLAYPPQYPSAPVQPAVQYRSVPMQSAYPPQYSQPQPAAQPAYPLAAPGPYALPQQPAVQYPQPAQSAYAPPPARAQAQYPQPSNPVVIVRSPLGSASAPALQPAAATPAASPTCPTIAWVRDSSAPGGVRVVTLEEARRQAAEQAQVAAAAAPPPAPAPARQPPTSTFFAPAQADINSAVTARINAILQIIAPKSVNVTEANPAGTTYYSIDFMKGLNYQYVAGLSSLNFSNQASRIKARETLAERLNGVCEQLSIPCKIVLAQDSSPSYALIDKTAFDRYLAGKAAAATPPRQTTLPPLPNP